jgi:hypothetical protein
MSADRQQATPLKLVWERRADKINTPKKRKRSSVAHTYVKQLRVSFYPITVIRERRIKRERERRIYSKIKYTGYRL